MNRQAELWRESCKRRGKRKTTTTINIKLLRRGITCDFSVAGRGVEARSLCGCGQGAAEKEELKRSFFQRRGASQRLYRPEKRPHELKTEGETVGASREMTTLGREKIIEGECQGSPIKSPSDDTSENPSRCTERRRPNDEPNQTSRLRSELVT